jgi:uroporphyrinogen-III synthase
MKSVNNQGGPLAGRTIALPETRELDRLSSLLVREGATILSCPMIGIRDTDDTAPVDAWLNRLAAGGFDDLILTTGEGVTRLLAMADRAGQLAKVLDAMANVRTITRGPKPARALHQAGLLPSLPAVEPTTDGIIKTLAAEPLQGRSIGLQLYGQDPNARLVEFLERSGARVASVAPYRYLPAAGDEEVEQLILQLCAGAVDAIAFTTRKQVERLFDVAEGKGIVDELRQGWRRTKIAAVGPVVVDELNERGVRVDAVPERSFFLRPLVEQLVQLLIRTEGTLPA